MKNPYNTKNFTLYRISTDDELLVAVANEYLGKIKHAIQEFGGLENIPPDWEVRGIFIDISDGKEIKFDPDGQQSEIIINTLAVYRKAA